MGVIVGVDIGGSGLRVQCRYAAGPGPVLRAPGARVGSEGIDVATLVRDAAALVGEPVDAVAWSMRGLLFLADRDDVLRQVGSGLGARRTAVVSDAVASVVGAVGSLGTGAVVAAGTGAVAFGTDFAGHWTRVDGWGHLLGDTGSGAWLGLQGLRAALRSRDGLPEGSGPLLAAGLARFGPVEGWPRLVMTSSDAPERLAGFAPDVTALAGDDPVAAALCVEAGRSLAQSLLAASAGLQAAQLFATGGVLAAAPVRTALEVRLGESGAELGTPCGGALEGALELATVLARGGTLPAHPAYLVHT